MPVQWYHYHSAFELAVAVDLAIFALPNIREPAITAETGRWERLCLIVPPNHAQYVESRTAMRTFLLVKRDIDAKLEHVRGFCAILVAICSCVLVWGTVFADEVPTAVDLIWLIWGISVTPVVIVAGLDGAARRRLLASSSVRQRIENEVIEA